MTTFPPASPKFSSTKVSRSAAAPSVCASRGAAGKFRSQWIARASDRKWPPRICCSPSGAAPTPTSWGWSSQGFMKILVDAEDRRILGAALLGNGGDEVVHCILDLMYARAPYTVMQRAMHIHPTVSELLPTMLGELEPLELAAAAA